MPLSRSVMYRSDPVYAVLLMIEERSVVGIGGNQPVRSSGGWCRSA